MPRIVLIEDDHAVRAAPEMALRCQGHRISAAASGEAGLQLIADDQPDVVVLDLIACTVKMSSPDGLPTSTARLLGNATANTQVVPPCPLDFPAATGLVPMPMAAPLDSPGPFAPSPP